MVLAIDDRVEQYRRAAEDARMRADGNPANRDAFLHVAKDWEALAREVERLVAKQNEGSEA